MNTPSHVIINAALRKALPRIAIPRGAFLIGGFMPDMPLLLLSIGGFLYYRYVEGRPTRDIVIDMFNRLFFTDPFWIACHNLLHSPTMLLIFLAIFWRWRDQPGHRGHWFFWFFCGCMVHTALDIPTHVLDGPVIFFPFNWSYRFQSVISYWDENYYGREFTIFELCLNVLLLGYLFGPRLLRWLQQRRAEI
jgi:membrane-bound metal-dependent hydrolase YbcI (DUF457 family)